MAAQNLNIYLIGNPNSGKSSLFNHLTGLQQKIANYPGVTTEKKMGVVKGHFNWSITDLPGCYSLYPNSIDEKVVLEEIIQHPPQLILFVADATNLNRSLLLYTQLADLRIPIILVINMIDELERQGKEIDIPMLQKEIGCNIIVCNSRKGTGIAELKNLIAGGNFKPASNHFGKKELFSEAIKENQFTYLAWHQYVIEAPKNAIVENIKRNEIIDRYNQIEQILNLSVRKTHKAFQQKRFSDKLDKIALHPAGGWILMLSIMYLVFQTLFFIAQFPMEWLDNGFSFLSSLLEKTLSDGILKKFTTQAIIPGIAGVLIFIPQIALLFFLNTFLEESGYLARMVFLLDNLMRRFGMSGKSVLPLLSGNACAIPAIASTKTIPTQKERIITILAIPFMTCSARLPVYTLLIALIIPLQYQGLSILGMYLLGAIAAMLFGAIANKIIKTEEKSFLIMELPPYRLPTFKNIATNIKNAVVSFVKVAGKFILSISIVLWFISSYGFINGKFMAVELENSVASHIGHAIEPAIEPLGYDWKIGVALITSFAAREVFVSTLNTLYHIEESNETQPLLIKMRQQINPTTQKPVFTLASGLSLLIFYAFALQCMSTLAAIVKETGTYHIAIISFILMSVLAYLSAFCIYQIFK